MEQILLESAKQIPAITAFVVLVMVFLNFIRNHNEDFKGVIERNTQAFNRNTEMLGHASAIFGDPGDNNLHR
jgi:hypothetical protein